MANDELNTTQSRQSFFQQAITRMATHWSESQAVQDLQVTVLDKERETILKAITLALDVKPAWGITKNLITTFTPYMERRGHWDVWQDVLTNAINKAETQNDDDTVITFTVLLARIFKSQTRYAEMVKLYAQVIRLAKKSGNQYEEARACTNLGYYFVTTANWWRAEVLNCHALELFESLKSNHGLAHTHNHLGQLYQQKYNWEKAKFHFLEATKIWEAMQDRHGLFHVYNNLGNISLEEKKFNKALELFQQAQTQAEITGDVLNSIISYRNIAITYLDSGQYDLAKQFALKAETLCKKYKDEISLAKTWQVLGEIESQTQQSKSALQYFDQALEKLADSKYAIDFARVITSQIEHFHREEDAENFKKRLKELLRFLSQHRLLEHRFFKDKINEYHQNAF